MFIIKYHKPKCKTMYFSVDGLKSDKRYATAIPECVRAAAEKHAQEYENMYIVDLSVSAIAEQMYSNKTVRVKDIVW